jgi:hypothetical protein
MRRLRRHVGTHRERERDQIEACELLRQVSASAGAVATMYVSGFRAMMVLSTEGMFGTRRHAHRFVRRSRPMHRARRDEEKQSAVGHQPEANQRSEHASSDRATHHAQK